MARAKAEEAAYAHGGEHPLGSYGVLIGAYGAAVGAAGLLIRARRPGLPEQLSAADLALASVATYRLSRLITKDSVTSVVRAPFTRFQEPAGDGEVNEQVRGTGPRHAVGELLSCPFCLGQWIATGLVVGLVVAPRATRLIAATLGVVAASDVLEFGHAALTRIEQQEG